MDFSISTVCRLNFNPRPPRGGRRSALSKCLTIQGFQSTPPARGATSACGSAIGNIEISIHAPREGGDCFSPWLCLSRSVFQSTPPARGATYLFHIFLISSYLFQSTPPARGATAFPVSTGCQPYDFNPRPPRGGRPHRVSRQYSLSLTFQSTPPARGATSLSHRTKACVS